MGELLEATGALDATYHMGTYARKQVMFVRGEGMRLYDDDGREYLDFIAGIGAVNLGHAHPAVTEAVAAQAAKLVHVSNLFHVEHRAHLAEVIATLAGGGRKVFFANSGTEAVEGAIKLARRWGKLNKGPECYRIITAERSFHGRTLGALTATAQPSKQEAFAPLLPGFGHVPLNDMAALEDAIDDTVCAVMLEVVQGEGGVYPCTPEYLTSVRRLCDERGVLLVLDEVQTGFFRTGTAFAHQSFGIRPDIMALAKAMANGLPIGAVVATDEVAAAFKPGDHGSTFGGGPVVCAAALATVGALHSERLGDNAIAMGEYLRDGLAGLAEKTGEVAVVRGIGLMAAAELSRPIAAAVAAGALARGLVLNNIGDSIIRFLPPLVCKEAEIDTLLETLEAVVGEV
ncbi:MAG: aspartate aminotransferase family protein [Coriobacteriia bacterium]|nr:aspartate aminotransferase family protein [Coriobacteriia bacterium]MBN2822060.1 aspartate aminotransferase family protein [Coriobacteriia bacterium]